MPDTLMLPQIAAFFGVSIDSLFFGSTAPNEPAPILGAPVADFADDGVLRVVQFLGNRPIASQCPCKEQPIALEFEAAQKSLAADHPLHVEVFGSCVIHGTVRGDLRSEQDVTCSNVLGSVTAGGSITCENVDGNAEAGGNITCDDIDGDASAGGSITCDDIDGSVVVGGDITCDSIDGDVTSSGRINCDTIEGDVTSTGSVSCDVIEGDLVSHGSLRCDSVGGNVSAEGDTDEQLIAVWDKTLYATKNCNRNESRTNRSITLFSAGKNPHGTIFSNTLGAFTPTHPEAATPNC